MHNRVATIYAILSDTYAVYIGTYDHAYMVPGMDNVRIKFLTDDHKTTNPRTLSWCIATGSCVSVLHTGGAVLVRLSVYIPPT